MSIRFLAHVWDDDSVQNRVDLLVLLAIADFCDEFGKAWPSIDTLAKKARCSQRAVQEALGRLKKVHLNIQYGTGPYGCNLYELNYKHGGRATTFKDVQGGANGAGGGEPAAGGGVRRDVGGGCAEPYANLHPIRQEPSGTTVSTEKVANATVAPPEKKKAFEKPTVAQVTLYAHKIGLPESEVCFFYDHFESNGWRVGGKARMNSWEAAMRTWKYRWQERNQPSAKNHAPMTPKIRMEKIRLLEEVIMKHPANKDSIYYKSDVTHAQKENLRCLRADVEKLKAEL